MPRITNRLSFSPVPVTPGVAHPASQDFDLSMELFVRDRKLMNARPQTIKWYEQHLRYFRSYLSGCKLPTAPAEITIDMVEDFILHQRFPESQRILGTSGLSTIDQNKAVIAAHYLGTVVHNTAVRLPGDDHLIGGLGIRQGQGH